MLQLKLTTSIEIVYLIEVYRRSTLLKIIEHCSLNPLLGAKNDSLDLFVKGIAKE